MTERSGKAWRKRQILITIFAIFTVSFVATVFLHHRKCIKQLNEGLNSYDSVLEQVSLESYTRIRPYFDRVADHYRSETVLSKAELPQAPLKLSECEALVFDFDAVVAEYLEHGSDAKWDVLIEFLLQIKQKECVKMGVDLLRFKRRKLSLAALSLAPLPSRFFSEIQCVFARDPRVRDDSLLKYIISLRLGRISRFLVKSRKWFNVYLSQDFQMGNVPSLPTLKPSDFNTFLYSQLSSNIPELSKAKLFLKSTTTALATEEVIDTLIKNSELSFEAIDAISPNGLSVPSASLVQKAKTASDVILIRIKQYPDGVTYIQANPRATTRDGKLTYNLKAIILRDMAIDVPQLIVYDSQIHLWTLLHPDGRIVTMPAPVVILMASKFDLELFYFKS